MVFDALHPNVILDVNTHNSYLIAHCLCSSIALAKGGQATIYDERTWVVFYFIFND